MKSRRRLRRLRKVISDWCVLWYSREGKLPKGYSTENASNQGITQTRSTKVDQGDVSLFRVWILQSLGCECIWFKVWYFRQWKIQIGYHNIFVLDSAIGWLIEHLSVFRVVSLVVFKHSFIPRSWNVFLFHILQLLVLSFKVDSFSCCMIIIAISYFFMSYLPTLWGAMIASTGLWLGFTFAVPTSVSIISVWIVRWDVITRQPMLLRFKERFFHGTICVVRFHWSPLR